MTQKGETEELTSLSFKSEIQLQTLFCSVLCSGQCGYNRGWINHWLCPQEFTLSGKVKYSHIALKRLSASVSKESYLKEFRNKWKESSETKNLWAEVIGEDGKHDQSWLPIRCRKWQENKGASFLENRTMGSWKAGVKKQLKDDKVLHIHTSIPLTISMQNCQNPWFCI